MIFLAKAGFDLAPAQRRCAMVQGDSDSELLRLAAEPTRTKTGLLVLITPHVVHEQRDTRVFTDDLCELPSAARVPYETPTLPSNGPIDRTVNMRRTLQFK